MVRVLMEGSDVPENRDPVSVVTIPGIVRNTSVPTVGIIKVAHLRASAGRKGKKIRRETIRPRMLDRETVATIENVSSEQPSQ